MLSVDSCQYRRDSVGLVVGGGWVRTIDDGCSLRVFADVFPGEVYTGVVSDDGVFFPKSLLYADWRGRFWRNRWNVLSDKLGEDSARVIFGMVTGLPLEPRLRYKLSTWSLVHLFVVSGTHLDIVALILYALGLEALIPAGLLAFAYMVGWPPSVVRALIFWILLVVLKRLGVERVHVPTLFAFTALVGMWLLPYAFGSLSFWLSLGIASALLWAFQVGSYIIPVLSIWFVSSLAFSGISLVVLLYPVVALLSAAVMAIFMFAILFPEVGWLAGYIAQGVQMLPVLGFPFYIRMCSFWAFLFAGLLVLFRGRRKLGLLLVSIPMMLSVLLVWVFPSYVAVFDVGEGSSALLRSSGFNLLVDTGRPNVKALLGVTRGMAWLGIDRIDAVVLSHPDADHTGGYRYIPGISRLHAITNGDGCNSIRRIGNVELWFPPCIDGWTDNERSIVVFRPSSFVIFGDLEDRGMQEFLAGVSRMVCPSDLVVMPHHGSWDDGLSEMLDICTPKAAVISVGPNPYGHPRVETLRLLEGRGIRLVWRTDESGSAVFLFDRGGRLMGVCPLNSWWWMCALWGL